LKFLEPSLSRLGNEKFDLIVTDPPYRDDVAYAELSDLYYVWLKRALSGSSGTSLVPRFHADVFFAGSIEVSLSGSGSLVVRSHLMRVGVSTSG